MRGRKEVRLMLKNQSNKSYRTWKISLNLLIILAVVFLILSFRYPIFSNQLYARTYTHNFKLVKSGSVLDCEFTLRNLHPWPVTVTGIAEEYGHTDVTINKTPPFTLYPMQSVTLRASVDTKGKIGGFENVVRILTSDNKEGTPVALVAVALP